MTVTPLRRDQTASRPAAGSGAAGDPRRPHRGPTSGLAPGYVQGNLAILPQALAADFMRFCQLNPKPCPLLGRRRPAIRACRRWARTSTSAPTLPRYRVWRNGELVDEPDGHHANSGATIW